MKTLTVNLGDRSYPIYIGSGLLSGGSGLIRKHIRTRQVMVVTNETIAPLYLEKIHHDLEDLNVENMIIPDGEQYKNLDVMNNIISRMLECRFGRDSCLVALGGGVVGDITGFAAACYQRGIDYIQIPTTVLAQVDSSVGGKTAVNHELGKNMIGAFHQPRAVISDITVLDTLDNREYRAGLAEVIKYGLIKDEMFYNWLEENLEKVLNRDPDALIYAIENSCQNKAEIVSTDETESGLRALLNLGHTFGHAIETGLGYMDWLHGEAVATGMLMAADLSQRMGWLSAGEVKRLSILLEKTGLPVRPPGELDPDRMQELMSVDKKAREGELYLVLLKDIGNAIVTNKFDPDKLIQTLNHFCIVKEAV